MGAWGIGIFSNDTAADVREDFRGLVAAGVSAADAAARLHEEYGVGGDADYDADFWLGLAAAQHRLGHVDGEVLRRAIDIIDSEQNSSVGREQTELAVELSCRSCARHLRHRLRRQRRSARAPATRHR